MFSNDSFGSSGIFAGDNLLGFLFLSLLDALLTPIYLLGGLLNFRIAFVFGDGDNAVAVGGGSN